MSTHHPGFPVRLFIIVLPLLITACSSSDSSAPPPSPYTVMLQSIVEPGDICPAGGVRIDSGIDDNRNSVLDPSEVDASEVVCNGVAGEDGSNGNDGIDGSDGLSSLIKVTAEAPDAACFLGRRRIEVGVDLNRNQLLDDDEIEHTEYICPQYTMPFKGLVFTENPNFDSMRELFAVWPSAGATVKVAAPRYGNMSINNMVLSPDKSHVGYFIKALRQYYIADLLHPYSEPVPLTEGLAGADRAGYFAWSPDGRFVAFTAGSDARGEAILYSALADGSGITLLTPIDPPSWANVTEMAWSPDSQYVAFTYDLDGEFLYKLYTVKPDGSNMRLISEETTVVYPAINWAPDGSRIAYMDSGQQYLFTVLPTGGTPVTVAGPPVSGGKIRSVYWAPNSKYIAFQGDYDVVNIFDIYTTLPEQADVTRITRHLEDNGVIVSSAEFRGWSHDGSLLAYVADEEVDEVFDLYVSTPNAERLKVSAIEGNVQLAKWLPAELLLLYENNDNELYLVESDGGNHRNILTSSTYFSYVDLSPNGAYLVYMEPNISVGGETLSEVFIYDIKQNTSVSVSPAVDGGYWSNLYPGIQWSPDSSMLAFKIAYPHPDYVNKAAFVELYSVFADGSGLQNLTVQDKPDPIDPYKIDLGVDRIHFQGDYLTHYFLSM